MNPEIGFLIFLIFYLFAWIPCSIAKYKSFGPAYISSNRGNPTGELSRWGGRSQRAYDNLRSYAPIFIGTVLFAFYKNLESTAFGICVWLFLIGRVLHYAFYVKGHVTGRAISWFFAICANLYLIILLMMD